MILRFVKHKSSVDLLEHLVVYLLVILALIIGMDNFGSSANPSISAGTTSVNTAL